MIKVLFVCLGNICRSPLAEGHFLKLIQDSNLQNKIECDSCGTSHYHIGDLADPRTRKNAEKNGINLTHRGRQLTGKDFYEFDYILAMDESNIKNINALQKEQKENTKAKIFLMRYFDNKSKNSDVPDPYYRDEQGFEDVFRILERSTFNFMEFLKKESNF